VGDRRIDLGSHLMAAIDFHVAFGTSKLSARLDS
jgi:hypothetical protein